MLFSNSIFIENYLHIYQLRDYNFKRYFKYFLKKRVFYHIFCVILLLFQIFFKNLLFLLSSNLLMVAISSLYHLSFNSSKTPIKFTKKIKIFYILSVLILLIISPLKYFIVISNVLLLFLPVVADIVDIYDRIKNHHYIKLASEKVKLSKTKIIAITGSNGKTSVKNILHEFLQNKFQVLSTPKSYNTPLGIAKFINDNDISKCQYLILEYGARHIGDIKKLCKLFGADYGIITLVAPQHLESFHNVENVYKAKSELSKYLKTGLCIYNVDNLYTYRMYCEKPTLKISSSIYSNADIYATDIKIKDYKTYFTLHIDNKSYKLKTNLLGRHNISNILLSIALSHKLGIEIDAIIDKIKNLKFIPHRLELIKSHINILDDSYNCSISSATESLFVLNQFVGKKLIVTPGIIEGGKNEYNINYQLGKMCADFDYLIIVGRHNKIAILNGVKSANGRVETIFANNLNDAKKYFKILDNGDNILLLNDLPDDYT